MLYHKYVVDRIYEDLKDINVAFANRFLNEAGSNEPTLKKFAKKVNDFFESNISISPVVSVPQNCDALPYWIEDIKRYYYPNLILNGARL